MSVDTITRVNAFFKANIEDPNNYYTVYVNDNSGLLLSSSGTTIELSLEDITDSLSTTGGQYEEEGSIIASVYVESGENQKLARVIADKIKVAFRAPTKLAPAAPGDGTIYFRDIDVRLIGDVPRGVSRSTSQKTFRKVNVFMSYLKTCIDS